MLLPSGSACRRTQDPTTNVGVTESGARAAPLEVKAVKSSHGCSTHHLMTPIRSHTKSSGPHPPLLGRASAANQGWIRRYGRCSVGPAHAWPPARCVLTWYTDATLVSPASTLHEVNWVVCVSDMKKVRLGCWVSMGTRRRILSSIQG